MSKTTRGKKICGYLKGIRRKIAEENDIKLDIPECTYEGECRGTCPRCEWEVQYLEKTLFERMKLGKIATISGLALGLSACGGNPGPIIETTGDVPNTDTDNIEQADTLPLPPPDPDMVLPVVGELVIEDFIERTDTISDTTKHLASDAKLENNNKVEGEEEWMGLVVETPPEFPGGEDALYEFLAKNIKYPQAAKDSNIQGRVFVQFVVEKDGTITNPKVIREIGGGCGKEALRVVKMMPKWKPGDQRGVKIRTQFNLPITFSLDD
ncbi:MAG: energy transducer TonB [Bacteroidales bacterium]|nr:energy transducer TonB [Bacteroidales bacterium]